MKKLLIVGLLAGCSTVHTKPDPRIEVLEHKVDNLEDSLKQAHYFIATDLCFTELALCRQDTKMTEKKCWHIHETCVINVYSMYKKK